MAIWGLIVAGALLLGSLPFLVGLAVVMPVLGHSTWHLYRKVVEPDLVGGAENDPGVAAQRAAFRDGLARLGWIEGRNLQIVLRYGTGDADHIRALAAELVSLALDVIVTNTGTTTRAAQQQTQTDCVAGVVGLELRNPSGTKSI
jgi:hypothetical protein